MGGVKNNMNDIDLDELERLANQAPYGPWEVVEAEILGETYCAIFLGYEGEKVRARGYGRLLDDEDKRFICSLDDGELEMYVDKDEMINTAAYIAAMNPGTVKALIARIRELEAQVAYPPVGTCAECSHWGASWEKKEDDPKRCAMMKTGICMDGELERDDTLAKGYGNYDADSGWVETKSSFSCCMFERKEK